jgi:hypothetical protein
MDEHLTDGWVAELGDHTPTLRERRQARAGTKRSVQNPAGCLLRVLRDVPDDRVEGIPRGLSPGYFSDPSSHLRRRSAATCSCGMTRPASPSARPEPTAWTTYKWYITSSKLQSFGRRSRSARTVSFAVTGASQRNDASSIRPSVRTAKIHGSRRIDPSRLHMGGRRQLPVRRPARLRSRLGTTHHSRASLPPFGPGARPSANAIRPNSTAPGLGNGAGANCREIRDRRKVPFPGSTWVGRQL